MNRRGETFPFLLEMTNLAQLDFAAFLSRNNFAATRLRIITGKEHSRGISEAFAKRIRGMPIEIVYAASNEIAVHESICKTHTHCDNALLVVGIGGGAVLDIAKYHATQLKVPYLAIPTVISNDGVASPIAILKNTLGDVQSYSTAPPIGILIDQGILSRAPDWALANGMGDILSNHAAVMDWDLAIARGHEEPNALARMMSRTAVQNVLVSPARLSEPAFLERYINAIVLSGLAMYISGNSRPCSGAEHLLAHVITKDQPTRYGHGFLVGSIAPFVAWLHDPKDRSLLPLAKVLGLKLNFASLLGNSRNFGSLLDEARCIRGKRFTILNEYSNEELLARYQAYLRFAREAPRTTPSQHGTFAAPSP
ncbi:MAG: glycerol-1-phosphate dehydrogenase [NAD(P)+] [Myxococcota bacterium]|jgi:glycerol-1-phosphate dehydrogenase [NAD(P)+]